MLFYAFWVVQWKFGFSLDWLCQTLRESLQINVSLDISHSYSVVVLSLDWWSNYQVKRDTCDKGTGNVSL